MLKLAIKNNMEDLENHLLKNISKKHWILLKELAYINRVKLAKMVELLIEREMKNEKKK